MAEGKDSPVLRERTDRSFDLLSSAYRRRVIYALVTQGPASVGELADAVVSAGIADARDRAVVSLVHMHLPKLDDFDVVEYAGPDEAVSLGDEVERLEPYLSVAARREADLDSRLSFGPGGFDAVADTSLD